MQRKINELSGPAILQFHDEGLTRSKCKVIHCISLFREEISACAAVHMCYVMDACDRVPPIILLPPMMGTSFVLVVLTRLIVNKPKHRVSTNTLESKCINLYYIAH